ncbi:MAG: SufE family protein, partial [Pirellulaceae bacterium]|nr:SufE family protein [Pirellulaceae bacterium]
MSSTLQNACQKLMDDFDLFDTWEDRYRYIIELGDGLEPLDAQHQVEAHRVQGCVSNVWLVREAGNHNTAVHFRADSDSQLVKGLIAIVLMIYCDRTPKEIIEFDINDLFEKLDL